MYRTPCGMVSESQRSMSSDMYGTFVERETNVRTLATVRCERTEEMFSKAMVRIRMMEKEEEEGDTLSSVVPSFSNSPEGVGGARGVRGRDAPVPGREAPVPGRG